MTKSYEIYYDYKNISINHNNIKYTILFDIKNDNIDEIKLKIKKNTKNEYNDSILDKFLK